MFREAGNIVGDLRGLASTGVRAVRTRLELLGIELKEEKAWLVRFLEWEVPRGRSLPDYLGVELLAYLQSQLTSTKFAGRDVDHLPQAQRLHYLFTLRYAKTGWTLEQRKAWIAAFRRWSSERE